MAYTHLAYFEDYIKDLEHLTKMLERQISRGPVTADKDQVIRLYNEINKLGNILSEIPLCK